MRVKDIVIGEYYRHKDTLNYGWAKALEVIPPKTGVNVHNYYIVKCEWAPDKSSSFGVIKYFKASDITGGK